MEDNNRFSLHDLNPVLPFISSETVDDLLEKSIDQGKISYLLAIAPFASRERISEFVEKTILNNEEDVEDLIGIVPFVEKKTIQKIVDHYISLGKYDEIAIIAVFLN